METSDEDPQTKAIKADIAIKFQSKEWQEQVAKNNIFSDCADAEPPRRNGPVVAPIRNFTTLSLGKRQRNNWTNYFDEV